MTSNGFVTISTSWTIQVSFIELVLSNEFYAEIEIFQFHFAGNKNNLRMVKRLEKFCMKEVYDIEMCHQCYLRSNTQSNWFTAVCDPPHLLVWARVNGQSGYAPAKVLGLNGSSAALKKVDVRFFADHEMALVPISNCYVFGKRAPLEKSYEQTKFKQITALQVSIVLVSVGSLWCDLVSFIVFIFRRWAFTLATFFNYSLISRMRNIRHHSMNGKL